MSKYNVSTLAKKLSEKSGLNQTESELFIRKMFDVANQGLETDKLLKMKWLGSFKVTSVKKRESVDVNTGERILIEGRDKISFTPDSILKEIVNKPFAQFETVVVEDGVEFDDIDRKFDAVSTVDEAADDGAIESANQQEIQSEKGDDPIANSNRVSSVLENVSADLNTPVDMREASVTVSQDSVLSLSETSNVAPGVVDFLDSPSPEETSSQVIVVGDETSVILDNPEHQDESEHQDEPKHLGELCVLKEIDGQENNENQEGTEIVNSKVREESVNLPAASTSEAAHSDEQKNRLEYLENQAEIMMEEEKELRKHHFVLPKYLVIVVILVFLVMIGGFGWFAFNYGKIAAQRDHLAMQLDWYQAKTSKVQAKAKAKPKKVVAQPKAVDEDVQDEHLREKACQDSLRLVKASEAVEAAENAKKKQGDGQLDKQDNQNKLKPSNSIGKYDDDVRVRTGAYRIVGVAQVVKVSAGQTLASISSRYLGPGMECYVEALNGITTVKVGQSVKIPKLELKKKNKTE